MNALTVLAPDRLSDWRDHVPFGAMSEWRAYAADAVEFVEEPGVGGVVARYRKLTGWRSEAWSTPEGAMNAAKRHGTGRYLIAMFTMGPRIRAWRGKLATVIEVHVDALISHNGELLESTLVIRTPGSLT